ncbi:MAG: HAMP domain-containing protein [Desulfovibrionaceae bacterium]|jgi:signal transduction histidine kinase|nr:HAMP domain-containing protein [Desulfovibrionaceae bacterium]
MRLRQLTQTIRGKVVILFAVTFVSICMLTLWSVASLYIVRGRLLTSERYDDLLKSILEVRRFEKNLLYFHDPESLADQLGFLDKIEVLSDELAEDIVAVSSAERFTRFRNDLTAYKHLAQQFHAMTVRATAEAEAGDAAPAVRSNAPGTDPALAVGERIRALGKEMLQYVDGLLKTKRARIHSAILRTSILPFFFLAVFVLLMVLLGKLLFSRLLKPLAAVSQVTRRVARGDFSPVSCEGMEHDEIHDLLCALNRMAQELEVNQEDLLQARKMAALGTFTAGIAHELNNPLNNISITAQALVEDYGETLDAEATEMLGDLITQSERAGEIVKDLLDFSRTEQPSFTPLSILDVIQDTIGLLKNQLMVNNVTLRADLERDLPRVAGNARNLGQAFMNLILNAIQAMEEGGTITLGAHRSGEGVRVDIRDTGKGMSEEQMQHIFEPFYTTKRVGQGTGLGLAVTYSLVRRHRGRIEVQSEPDGGTVFSIYLPAVRTEPAEPDPAPGTPPGTPPDTFKEPQ